VITLRAIAPDAAPGGNKGAQDVHLQGCAPGRPMKYAPLPTRVISTAWAWVNPPFGDLMGRQKAGYDMLRGGSVARSVSTSF
jgi:hypothetical protein